MITKNSQAPASRKRIVAGPTKPDQHALKIAEKTTETWHQHHGRGDLDIPLSTVAALALLTPPNAEQDDVTGEWICLTPPAFQQRMLGLWNWVVLTRPDLVNPLWPLISVWHNENHPICDSDLNAAKQVADAVLRADLIGLTGTERRFETDLLGAVLTLLRPKAALQDRGLYYTSSAIADTIVACTVVADLAPMVDEGQTVQDPACGTGGMIRAAAKRMRTTGRDPHATLWTGCDIDPMAIACFAVNAIVWDLGPNVIAACGDTLAWDGFYERANAARQETIELARALMRDRMMVDLLRNTTALADLVDNERHRRKPVASDPTATQNVTSTAGVRHRRLRDRKTA